MRVDPDVFERLYRDQPDPWNFVGSPYEQRKYEVTIASLPRRRYDRCFEPGCSIGVLTERLATVCDEVIAIDGSPSAIATATRRLDRVAGVSLAVGTIPDMWPTGEFDLVVLSEIGYYWDEPSLAGIVDKVRGSLAPGGDVIAVHWLGQSPDHVLSGQAVHQVLDRCLSRPIVHHVETEFVLDVWTAS